MQCTLFSVSPAFVNQGVEGAHSMGRFVGCRIEMQHADHSTYQHINHIYGILKYNMAGIHHITSRHVTCVSTYLEVHTHLSLV